ncbi:MAG: S8 family serine peptidase [Candidatus Cloacimonetes bacterium]|nr:S8 family serine peptidase [Candidatus Cloacimonadota bacterium]
MKKTILLVIIFVFCFSLMAKSSQVLFKIKTEKLKNLSVQLSKKWEIQYAEVLKYAEENKIPLIYEDENTFMKLHHISNTGLPIYYKTDNATSAKTISTDHVHPNGLSGLSLTGAGFLIGEWDGGHARITHQEFENRVTYGDTCSEHYHSTHVAGTMIGAGIDPSSKGMAYEADLVSYDWDRDEEELSLEVADGMILSNHSYGPDLGWRWAGTWIWMGGHWSEEDKYFGYYSSSDAVLDTIAYLAPHYLMIRSAGNDRNDGPGDNPDHQDDGPWDCISLSSLAKNILTVGATEDITNGYSQPSDVILADFSSCGPIDDGRVKPDIVANGVDLFSTDDDSDDAYQILGGTSMASPSVAASLLLMQEHYENLHGDGNFMLAATLKGLLTHTADEAGQFDGPDYEFGWGLMNTARMADHISKDGTSNTIEELTLNNSQIYQTTVIATGIEPLKATICWTDAPAIPLAPSLDDPTPMLVNDLDIRITRNSDTYYPWRLNALYPQAPASKDGDNYVDNVEQVLVSNPESAEYTITVSHKGTLVDETFSPTPQNFSLIISGLAEDDLICRIIEPVNGAEIESGSFVSIEVDPLEFPRSIDRVEFFINDATEPFETEYSYPYSCNWSTYDLEEGIYTIKAIAYDNADNSTEDIIRIHLYEDEYVNLPYQEDFENNGEMPDGWRESFFNGSTLSWQFTAGNGANNPSSAHSGSYNALLKDSDILPDETALITPKIKFREYTVSASMTFWVHMEQRSIYKDKLEIYYIEPGSIYWYRLVVIETNTDWQEVTMEIPVSINGIYLGFFGNAKNGYGICIDDVEINSFEAEPPFISLNETFIDYGIIEVGSSLTQSFAISNLGQMELIGSITLPSDQYSISEVVTARSSKKKSSNDNDRFDIAFVIPGGQSETFEVLFSPEITGVFEGHIEIISNTPYNPTETIYIYGEGAVADISTDLPYLYQTMYSDQTSILPLTILNNSDVNLNYLAIVEHAERTRNTIDVHLLNSDYNSGSCTTTEKTETSLIKGFDDEDGWMKFDISSIPANATINSATFNGYVNDTYYPYWSITPVSCDPISEEASILYEDINSEQFIDYYLFSNEDNEFSTGWKNLPLNNDAIYDLQQAISTQDWFAIGIVGRDADPQYFINFDGWNEPNKPYLTIDYTVSTTDWLSINGQNMIEGSILPNEDFEIEVGFDSATLPNGIYEASINISSNDPDENPYVIPITLEIIGELIIPDEIEISYENGNILLSWLDSGANSYKVFSAQDANGDFSDITEQGNFSITRSRVIWTMPIDESVQKLFFRVKSSTD